MDHWLQNDFEIMFKLRDFIRIDKVDWNLMSKNPNAIHLLEKNPRRVNWTIISQNPSIFELDYSLMKERSSIYKQELIEKALHPSKIEKYLDMGIDIEELNDYL